MRKLGAFGLVVAACAAAAAVAGCDVIFGLKHADLYTLDAGTGAGTVTTTASTGTCASSAVHCSSPSDCPSQSTVCVINTCEDGCCGTTNASQTATCTDSGGKLCDGKGTCVECNSKSDCGAYCINNACNDPVALAAPGGYDHMCAVLRDGSVYCWGYNANGEVGDGTTMQHNEPTKVTLPMPATMVSANGDGTPASGQTCAVLIDKSLWCWGNNTQGQLGVGDVASHKGPQRAAISNVVQVSTGRGHTCAIDTDQQVWCWGDNVFGDLGIGSMVSPMPTPTKVDLSATVVAAGFFHTCASDTQGFLICWGLNMNGQLGTGSTSMGGPMLVTADGASNAIGIAASVNSTCAWNSVGAYCWGENQSGELGIGSMMDSSSPTALPLMGTKTMALGPYHGGAIASAGLFMWGQNGAGMLGDGTPMNHLSPEAISLQNPSGVAISDLSTCALTTDGKLYCWGANKFGTLGNGTTTPSSTPVPVVWP